MTCNTCLKPIFRRKTHRPNMCELCYEESLIDNINEEWFLDPEYFFEKAKLTSIEIAVLNAMIDGSTEGKVIAQNPELTRAIYPRVKRDAWAKLIPYIQKESANV
jgi:hypothetical protein